MVKHLKTNHSELPCLCGHSCYLFVGRGQWDVCLGVQVISERSDLLSIPAVHPLHHRSPGRKGE